MADDDDIVDQEMQEVPEAEVVEERELPKKTGEETSETIMVGGRMMRVVKVGSGYTYVPL